MRYKPNTPLPKDYPRAGKSLLVTADTIARLLGLEKPIMKLEKIDVKNL